MDPIGSPSGSVSVDRHEIGKENPQIIDVEKRSISPDTQLQIAELIGYLANQFLANRPQLARDLSDLLDATSSKTVAPNPPEMTAQKQRITAMEKKQVDPVPIQVVVESANVDGNVTTPYKSKLEEGKSSSCSCFPLKKENKPPKSRTHKELKELNKKKNTLMLVSVLIATITFQAALNPPGGLWQDWKHGIDDSGSFEHRPGQAINQYLIPFEYTWFMAFDGLGLVASLSIILLLTDAVRIEHPWQMWVLRVIMWVSVTSVALAFIFGVKSIMHKYYTSATAVIAFLVIFYGAVFMWNLFRFLRYLCCRQKKSGSDMVSPV